MVDDGFALGRTRGVGVIGVVVGATTGVGAKTAAVAVTFVTGTEAGDRICVCVMELRALELLKGTGSGEEKNSASASIAIPSLSVVFTERDEIGARSCLSSAG